MSSTRPARASGPSRIRHIFEHIRLPALHLDAPGRGATKHVDRAARADSDASVYRILSFADLRRGAALLHFPIQAFTLWDFHCLFALESWRGSAGARVHTWFEAAAELDALSCLAAVRRDNPDWCDPHLTVAGERIYRAAGLGHPLLPSSRRVTNDVQLGPPGHGPTRDRLEHVREKYAAARHRCKRRPRAVWCGRVRDVTGTSTMRPPDQHQDPGLPRARRVYFMAALARLKGVVDAAEREPGDRALVYLLDEILQGTNSAERGIAVQAVARHLLDAGAIGAMTTHDLNLASEEPLQTAAHLVHFTEIVEHGTMRFDYRLRDGLATSRNALRLMELIGIPINIDTPHG